MKALRVRESAGESDQRDHADNNESGGELPATTLAAQNPALSNFAKSTERIIKIVD